MRGRPCLRALLSAQKHFSLSSRPFSALWKRACISNTPPIVALHLCVRVSAPPPLRCKRQFGGFPSIAPNASAERGSEHDGSQGPSARSARQGTRARHGAGLCWGASRATAAPSQLVWGALGGLTGGTHARVRKRASAAPRSAASAAERVGFALFCVFSFSVARLACGCAFTADACCLTELGNLCAAGYDRRFAALLLRLPFLFADSARAESNAANVATQGAIAWKLECVGTNGVVVVVVACGRGSQRANSAVVREAVLGLCQGGLGDCA